MKPPEEKPEEPKPEPEKPKEEKPEINVEEEVKKQLDEKVKELLQKANEKRKQNKEDNLNRVLGFAKDKKVITNDDVRDFLHVSQSTATNYLSQLVKSGKLKREGIRGGTKYSA